MLSRSFTRLTVSSFVLVSLALACSDESSDSASTSDSGTSTNGDSSTNTSTDGSTASDSGTGSDTGTNNADGAVALDSGADSGPTYPTNPAAPQTVTTGATYSGTIAVDPTYAVAHYYKYVPASAFSSVKVNLVSLTPANSLGTVRWQTDTNVGLCDTTGNVKCCTAPGAASCNLTIKEGANPVMAGKTYYIIATGGPSYETNYSFTITETM